MESCGSAARAGSARLPQMGCKDAASIAPGKQLIE